MVPKIGDVVSLNPKFLKVWFDGGNGYLQNDDSTYLIMEIATYTFPEIRYKVLFVNKHGRYSLDISTSGEFNISERFPAYKGIQVFIVQTSQITQVVEVEDSTYCSCDGLKKENWAGGTMFYFCTKCGKEKQ